MLHARALTDAFGGRYDLSRRRAASGLARLGSTTWPTAAEATSAARIRVRLLVLLAGMEYELQGGQGGRGHLDEAVAVADSIGAGDLIFVVEQTLALRATRGGRIEEALTHFSEAEARVDAASDLDVCKMLVNRGALHLERLELPRARHDLRRCLARAEGKPELLTVATMARHNLGYVEFLTGNLPAALQEMSAAAALGGQAAPAVALQDRARVLIAAGLIDAADSTLNEAAQRFRAGRMWAYLAEAELNRAECALLTGDFGRTRTLATSARSRFRRRGNEPWRRRSELVLLAGDLGDGRPPARLVAPATRLAEEFEASRLPGYAKTARLIACEALLASGRLAEATTTFQGVSPPERTDPIGVRLQQRTVAGLLARERGQPAAGHRAVRQGLNELERHQAQFGSVDLQTASALHGRRLAALDLEMALTESRPVAVFAALERGRALSRRLVAVNPPADESAPLLTQLRHLSETLAVIGADPAQTTAAAAGRRRVAELRDQLRRLSWPTQGSRSVQRHIGLTAVQERVRARDRQMVLYGRARGDLVAVVVGGGRPRLFRLAGTSAVTALLDRLRADLDVQAYPRVPEPLRRSAAASARRCLERLDALLLAPLGLADQGLIVVPTADLATLPWGSLPSRVGGPVEVAPTASSWWHGTRRPTPGPLQVAGFAGPGLAASEREVVGLRTVWPGAETYVGAAATGRSLVRSAATASLAHVAAHGTHVTQNPLFSCLQLADGPLFAYELAPGRLPAHMVLSACELGRVTVRPGEETLGLTSVLLHLGVQCVVSGVADVNDDLAAEVMLGYHRRLAAGDDAAAALAGASAATQTVVPFVCFGTAWSAY